MRYLFLCALLLLACCGPKPTTLDDFETRPVTLPHGQVIRVETMTDEMELLRGMMFRKSLAPDRGMLFVYPRPNRYQTFMYQVLIPLDIVWMDSDHRIVGLDENALPCKTQASKCVRYGGHDLELYALEIGGGMAKKYGLEVGQTIQW